MIRQVIFLHPIQYLLRGLVNKCLTFWILSHPSIDCCQILTKLRHLVNVWQTLRAENHMNCGENGKKWISFARQVLFFFGKRASLKPRISSKNTMNTLRHKLLWWRGEEVVYWIFLYSHEHELLRTFWTPSDVASPETIQEIYNMVMTDRRLKLEIVEAMGILHDSVVSIFIDHLGMEMTSAR